MKKVLFSLTIIGTSFLSTPIFSQEKAMSDSLGLPGDNLNLYGVLDLFQHSKTLEEFETKLNAQDSKINNLDLNGDNKTDYIKVVDNMQGASHAIVLQDAVNEKEIQDVAVIEVEKDAKNQIHIQVVGDEQLYGKNYIVEPKDETTTAATTAGTPNPGYKGPAVVNNTTNNYYNSGGSAPVTTEVIYPVATWGIFNWLFAPAYVPYYSPYYWGYYPTYWRPWRPLYWYSYYNYNHYYYGYYNRGYMYRAPLAHGYYGSRRSSSNFVGQRRATGAYNSTYSRRDMASSNRASRNQSRSGSNVSQNRGTRSTVQPNRSSFHSQGNASRGSVQRSAAPRSSAPSGNRGGGARSNGGGHSSGGGSHSSGGSHGGGRR